MLRVTREKKSKIEWRKKNLRRWHMNWISASERDSKKTKQIIYKASFHFSIHLTSFNRTITGNEGNMNKKERKKEKNEEKILPINNSCAQHWWNLIGKIYIKSDWIILVNCEFSSGFRKINGIYASVNLNISWQCWQVQK